MKNNLIDLDLTGKTFNSLEVIQESSNSPRKYRRFWIVFCVCGGVKEVDHYQLVSGRTKSCGCLRKKNVTKAIATHKKSYTAEYKIWDGMLQRCTNVNAKGYVWYGAKGIDVCEEWKNFEVFYFDMGKRPTWKHTLERIDNSKGYSPSNCIWATRQEQARNKSSNKLITWKSETLCLEDWAKVLGVKSNTLNYRLKRGWSVEEAFLGYRPSPNTE